MRDTTTDLEAHNVSFQQTLLTMAVSCNKKLTFRAKKYWILVFILAGSLPAVALNGQCSRRQFWATNAALASAVVIGPSGPDGRLLGCWAADGEDATTTTSASTDRKFELRDRQGNKQALIREDYWYMLGKTPPRRLLGPLKGDDPQWNAFGSCESTVKGGGNPCTYVSLNQRIPAYSKYGSALSYGAQDLQRLGQVLRQIAQQEPPQAPAAAVTVSSSDTELLWQRAAEFVVVEERSVPPPLVDAELKMILFATAMLTSPNFPQPSRELLVARYYANECHFASTALANAIARHDATTALQLWDYARDSWNSYFQVVNRSVSPKVGDPFVAVV